MSTKAHRVDLRRPFTTTAAGLRRIVVAGPAKGPEDAREKPSRLAGPPRRWHMAIAHADQGSLDEHARQSIAAAAILAPAETGVIAVVLGQLGEDLGPAGADRVAVFAAFDNARFAPETELAAVEAMIKAYDPAHVFLPDTASGDGDLGRRLIVAHRGDGAAHVREIGPDHAAVAWGGGARSAKAALPRIVLLDPGAVETRLLFRGEGVVLAEDTLPAVGTSAAVCRDLGLEAIAAESVALEEAERIVSAGNGVSDDAAVEALAKALGAAVGASRVAVDDGRYPRAKQIGATGKTVAANVYIAAGISGAVQHLQGIKDCRHVIAINRDGGAPIVKRADLAVIGDAVDVMQALTTRIAQAKSQSEKEAKG